MSQKLFCLAMILCLGASFADDGNGSGGGGNALRRGSYWRVADAAYRAPSYTRFTFDDGLRAEITAIQNELRDVHLLPRLDGFFDTQIYGPLVEFRLVHELPRNCHFVDDSDVHGDSNETNVHIGCTFGSITYLLEPAVQEALQTKNYLELALLIFHERFFPYAKNQESYEVISEIVQGIRLLMLHDQPVRQRYLAWVNASPRLDGSSEWVSNPPRIFTDDELTVVNALAYRLEQLTGRPLHQPFYGPKAEDFYLTPWGGLYNATAKVSDGVKLGMGARLRDADVSGKDITIVDSTVGSSMVEGERIQLVGSGLGGSVLRGSDIRIWSSGIGNTNLTVNDFTMENSQWASPEVSGLGRGLVFRNSVMDYPHWSCNDYTKKEHRFEKGWWLRSVLAGDHRVIDHKVFDANCKITEKP